MTVALLLFFGLIFPSRTVFSSEIRQISAAETPFAVAPDQLNRSIDDVLKRSEFAWRLPRDNRNAGKPPGLFESFINWVWDNTKKIIKTIRKKINSVADWFDNLFPKKQAAPAPSGNWMESVMKYTDIIIGLFFCLFIVFAWRIWKKRKEKQDVVIGESVPSALPDLSDEDVFPGDLPSDRWFSAAKELLDQMSFKPAVRAFYIGTLALLGEYRIITIAKYKSNREYAGELKRRISQIPEILSVFSSMTEIFEKSWYGGYDVISDDIGSIRHLSEKMIVLVKTS